MVLPAPRGVRLARLIARLFAVLAAGLGAVVLLGWSLDDPIFRNLVPDLMSMKPNGGAGFLAAGIALFFFTFNATRPLARLVGLALFLFGLLTLSQDSLGVDIGIDRALVDAPLLPDDATPAAIIDSIRMASGTSVSLALFGLALLFAKRGRVASAMGQLLAIAMLAQILILITGYVYGVATTSDPFSFAAMSVYSAAAVVLLALGLLAASPEYGIASVIVERSPAGEMLRRLLPGILILPLLIGWVAHQAELATYYDGAATLAIFAVASIVVLALFAWTMVEAVRRADRDRNLALMELRGQREWLSTTLSSIGDGVIATDPSGSVILLNPVAEQLTGWTMASMRGRPIWEVFRVVDEATREPIDDPALKALRQRRVSRLESGALLLTRDNKELPVEHSGAPIVGADGTLAGAVLIFRDVTERRRVAQRQTMLVGELNHRVKNALAIVQSLVQASLRQATSKSAQAMAETLAERLQALHRAHDLLLDSQWTGASLKTMVERELEPYSREDGPKIVIKGKDVLLPPHCTSIFAMTLHELATNAVKYGALSQNAGQLAVTWKTGRGDRLLLVWEERVPARRERGSVQRGRRPSGFGMQLIDKGIRHNLGGETKVEFRPTGLYVEINVSLKPVTEARALRAPAPAEPA